MNYLIIIISVLLYFFATTKIMLVVLFLLGCAIIQLQVASNRHLKKEIENIKENIYPRLDDIEENTKDY